MLPKKIIVLPNRDKKRFSGEKWTKSRDPLNFPYPARILLFGSPNCGKTNTITNILLRCDYEKVFLIHCDQKTDEYNHIPHTQLPSFPSVEEWRKLINKRKCVLILDDISFRLKKEQEERLNRLYGYVSSHLGLTIICATQNLFDMPVYIRRTSNVFIFYRIPDMNAMNQISRRIGMESKQMKYLFKKYIKKNTDAIWVDGTANSPYKIRKNGYEIIKK